MSAAPAVRVGDLVRRGRGKKTWRVVEFLDQLNGVPWAVLAPTEGYTSALAPVTALTVVDEEDAP